MTNNICEIRTLCLYNMSKGNWNDMCFKKRWTTLKGHSVGQTELLKNIA